MPESLRIEISERDTVTALLYSAAKSKRLGMTLILGHGAGGNQKSAFMQTFAEGLAKRGLDTATFNFLYSEAGRSGPDPGPRLESCFLAVIEAIRKLPKLKGNGLVLGGKSMGGRIGSQVAAALKGSQALPKTKDAEKTNKASETELKAGDIDALVFFGYPLHPPGRPDQMRDKHLKGIHAPMFFVQGTRDSFGTPDEFRDLIKRLHLPATLHLIESGDHSFKVTRSVGVPQEEVHESIMDEVVRWLKSKVKNKLTLL